MFSHATQYSEIDLAQYNSPSFATGNHISSNYQSMAKQIQADMVRIDGAKQKNDSFSSRGRDSDVYSLPVQYEQKIILHKARIAKSNFLKLPGEVLGIIGDYLNQKLPIFIFTNRISFKIFLQS
mmetsp:Transcript_44104/g.42798  ORF Transcript_44104/g.42798 Transcript_44104/m.42798 type:complete len:124 (-) Transcript_44104:527-898(-)